MFREFPAAVSRASTICLVAPTSEVDFLWAESRYWRQRGWDVHVLACPGPLAIELAGVRVTNLGEKTLEPALRELHDFPGMRLREQVRWALAELQRRHAFDLIEFVDRGGLGFRVVQAKRVGLGFGDVPLLVYLQGPTGRVRRLREQWHEGPADLVNDFCERYVWQHADGHCIRGDAPVEEIGRLGWNERRSEKLREAGVAARAAVPPHPGPLSPEYRGEREHVGGLVPQEYGGEGVKRPLVTVSVAYFNMAAFLEEALASLAAQTYANLEVIVINDGSTDIEAGRVFQRMKSRYPGFRFFQQQNAGIGATRNRGIDWAQGEYFMPMDADNLASPDMIARLVAGMERNPGLAALSCYFLAFAESSDLAENRFGYCYEPLGQAYALGCLRNVFGDGNALFRLGALRAVGGFGTDRETSFEDWEVFVKLLNAGHEIDVLPDYLFYYRHRDAGFSRATSGYRNRQRVLSQYVRGGELPPAERQAVWQMISGLQHRVDVLENENRALTRQLRALRYQVADRVQKAVKQVPFMRSALRWLAKRAGHRTGFHARDRG